MKFEPKGPEKHINVECNVQYIDLVQIWGKKEQDYPISQLEFQALCHFLNLHDIKLLVNFKVLGKILIIGEIQTIEI